MSASNGTERIEDDAVPNPWLRVTGSHTPSGFDVEIWGKPIVVTFNVFEYLLELIATTFEDPEGYLYNTRSVSCSRPSRDEDVDVDATARDRVRHLRKLMAEEIQTGWKGYRLAPHLSRPVVSKKVLHNPYLNAEVLDRLRRSITDNTPPEH